MGTLLNCHLGLLAFLLSSQLIALEAQTCNSGWVQNGTNCYKLFPDRLIFGKAEDVCQKQQPPAHVVSILSNEENVFVTEYLMLQDITYDVWIGLVLTIEDMLGPLKWIWTDGSPYRYTNWAPEHPYFFVNCASLRLSSNYTLWESTPCLYMLNLYICKYRLN